MEGYFKVHRKILDSQVFSHQTALKIWIWCLAKVSYKERFISLKIGKGETTVKILPGQFVFGRFKAEDELGIDGSTIYKWMQKFSSTEYDMINIESNNQYSIITICNWDEYQNNEEEKEQPSNNQVTSGEQPSNNQVTQTRKNKKDNKVKKEREYIKPTLEEVEKYFEINGYKNEAAKRAFMSYDVANWYDSKGNKVINWKQKMINVWFKPENRKPETIKPPLAV